MKIEEKILEYIKKEPLATSAFIFGSYARDPKKQHNDIDVVVLTAADWRKRETTTIGGFTVEIFYNTNQNIKKELLAENDFNIARWFENTKIISDKDNTAKTLIEFAHNLAKQKLQHPQKDWWQYKIADYLQDIKKETDALQKTYLMDCLLKELIKIFFLSKKLIPPKENYAIKKILEIDKALFGLIKKYYSEQATNQKEIAIKKIINRMEKDIGKPTLIFTTPKQQITN